MVDGDGEQATPLRQCGSAKPVAVWLAIGAAATAAAHRRGEGEVTVSRSSYLESAEQIEEELLSPSHHENCDDTVLKGYELRLEAQSLRNTARRPAPLRIEHSVAMRARSQCEETTAGARATLSSMLVTSPAAVAHSRPECGTTSRGAFNSASAQYAFTRMRTPTSQRETSGRARLRLDRMSRSTPESIDPRARTAGVFSRTSWRTSHRSRQ